MIFKVYTVFVPYLHRNLRSELPVKHVCALWTQLSRPRVQRLTLPPLAPKQCDYI
jgi:hypothetical protein